MSIEDQLRERLRKVEAVMAGSSSDGERGAAEAAVQRIRERLQASIQTDPPVELQFTMPDPWSVQLFNALCRRYGFHPYRYKRQRRTTVMVLAPKRAFDEVVWRQLSDLHTVLQIYLEQTTSKLIREALDADTSDIDEVAEPQALR